MKTNKFLTFFTLITLFVAMVSCVQDDDFSIPQSLGNEENEGLAAVMTGLDSGTLSMVTIQELKALFTGDPVEIESDIVVKGYVSSSDRTGNFYKEFYMQDDPISPTSGIKVVVNQVDSYNLYNVGREVYIVLKGLYIGETNSGDDVIAIGGSSDGQEIDEITANMIPDFIFRSPTTEALQGLDVSLSDIDESHSGIFVTVPNVQFPQSLVGQFYVNPYDDFDTQHALESCEDSGSFLLETSSFASFSQEILPTDGKGTISALVSKTYNGSDLVLVLNDNADFVVEGARCDPLFADSFSSNNLDKWTPYSVTGAQQWEMTPFGNPAPSAKMSGYSGGAQTNEDWLISQAIDLSGLTGATLNFQTVKRYSGNNLELYMSTDYSGGDPTTDGTWTALSASYDTNENSWSSWTDSGDVDVSAAAGGNLFIAFKYTSTTSSAATWEIDNVLVKAE